MGYIVDIYENNYKNNLYTTIVNIKIEENHIYNDYIYSDINNKR